MLSLPKTHIRTSSDNSYSYSQSHLGWHFRKLKAQSSNVSFATFQWKETFELWALSFETAFENVTPSGIGYTFWVFPQVIYVHVDLSEDICFNPPDSIHTHTHTHLYMIMYKYTHIHTHLFTMHACIHTHIDELSCEKTQPSTRFKGHTNHMGNIRSHRHDDISCKGLIRLHQWVVERHCLRPPR